MIVVVMFTSLVGIVNDIYIVPVNISYDKVIIINIRYSLNIFSYSIQLLEGSFHHELMVECLLTYSNYIVVCFNASGWC